MRTRRQHPARKPSLPKPTLERIGVPQPADGRLRVSDPHQVAIHEAGHVVIAVAAGCEIEFAALMEERLGHTDYYATTGEVRPLRNRFVPPEHEVAISFGGYAAELVHGYIPNKAKLLASADNGFGVLRGDWEADAEDGPHDYAAALAHAEREGLDEVSTDLLLRSIWMMTVAHLRIAGPNGAVVEMAMLLLNRRELSIGRATDVDAIALACAGALELPGLEGES